MRKNNWWQIATQRIEWAKKVKKAKTRSLIEKKNYSTRRNRAHEP